MGNCFLAKISSTLPLTLSDYFTPLNTVAESNADTDFGSGGPLLLPDVVDSNGVTRHLAVGAGKDSIIYVVDRDNMGKFNSSSDNIYQQINGALSGGVWSEAELLQRSRLLRRGRRFDQGVSDFSWQAGDDGVVEKFAHVRISRRDAGNLGKRHERRHRLGRGE